MGVEAGLPTSLCELRRTRWRGKQGARLRRTTARQAILETPTSKLQHPMNHQIPSTHSSVPSAVNNRWGSRPDLCASASLRCNPPCSEIRRAEYFTANEARQRVDGLAARPGPGVQPLRDTGVTARPSENFTFAAPQIPTGDHFVHYRGVAHERLPGGLQP